LDGLTPGRTPYVPTQRVPMTEPVWYGEEERDRLLDGMFRLQPRWYLFFYLTTRLGLRTGEVYAISKSRIRDIPPQLIVDRAVQRGNKERPALLGTRKNNRSLTLSLAQDVVDAIRWHIKQGYSGEEFLFSADTHLYAHLGYQAQLRLVEALQPVSPPHVNVRSTGSNGEDR